MTNNSGLSKLYYYLTVFAGALLLLIPAFYNGFPLVNSDTSAYIQSGFIPENPWDRPITYGMLIRLFSLNGLSLWLVAFVQALIMSWLVVLIIKQIAGEKHYRIYSFAALAILSIGTSLSWVTSELIADIYTPMALLCLLAVLLNKDEPGNNKPLYALYFFSVAAHTSHFIIFLALLFLLFFSLPFFFPKHEIRSTKKRLYILSFVTLCALVILSNPISKSKHAFFMASMLEKGILKKYLDKHCKDNNYKLCNYKDALPANANEFLWNDNSPFHKEGGSRPTKEEYNKIINATLTDPEYIPMYIGTSFQFSAKQLVAFNIGDGNTPFPANSNVNNTIAKYIPHEQVPFSKAKQNTGDLLDKIAIPNQLFYLIVIASIILLPTITIIKLHSLRVEYFFVLFVSITGILINAWDCATFSAISGRYGCRMIWLIPFCTILSIISSKKQKTTPSSVLP